MANLKGSQTEGNLKAAFAGESQANRRYLYFAQKADVDLPIGGTSDNLKSAIAGETHEYTDMYPGMAKSAREEGFEEIADWFETLAKAEKSHAGRFQKALDTLD
jgi:rubrerythrin